MSEEEIIEIIEKLQCEYKEQENDKKYNDYTVYKAKEYSKGLQGLLDLYNKEKEKNEKLELENEELKREKVKRSWVHIKENGEVEPLFYISEDKIKAKIEEIKEEKRHYLEINDEYNAQICDCIIEEYESLLEKE